MTDSWTILRLVPGGEGFCRLPDGRAGFAPGGLPGDQIRPLRVEERRGYVRAAQWELQAAGPDRVEPPCAYAEACGGCDWMHLGREAQVRAKVELLREALARTGKIHELPEPLRVEEHGPDTRYRNRVRLHVEPEGQIGMFARASHALVQIDDCLVGPTLMRATMTELRRRLDGPASALAVCSEIELRAAPAGPEIVLRLRLREPTTALASTTAAALDDLARQIPLSVAGQQRWGHEDQQFTLPGPATLLSGAGGFVQVNWAVNEQLVQAVLRGTRERAVARFCDLYCGAGNFTLPLLAAGLSGVAVERDARNVKAAMRSAQAAGLPQDGFRTGDAAREVRKLRRSGERFDLVLLDPPRAGARDVLDAVCQLGPPHLALCSCDPATLARDLRLLLNRGYALTALRGFDMFPHTHHVETLAWLSR